MNEFVEECRREWRRLGVPDPVANEMAADLTADLEEAAAEGATAEDVLGNSAFDPRRFAASWATAQGVTRPPGPGRPALRRSPVAIGLVAVLTVLTVGAVVVILAGRQSSAFAITAHPALAVPGAIRVGPLGPGRFGPLGVAVTRSTVLGLAFLVPLVLVIGLAGIAMVIVAYRSPWTGWRRGRRRGEGAPPSWF